MVIPGPGFPFFFFFLVVFFNVCGMEFSNAWLIMSPACWYKCRVWGFACGTASSWYARTACRNYWKFLPAENEWRPTAGAEGRVRVWCVFYFYFLRTSASNQLCN